MKRGEVLSATARAERSREATKAAIARELAMAGILARIWPSYVMTPDIERASETERRWLKDFPHILCIESPGGWLSWKLSPDEYLAFDWVPMRPYNGEKITDKMPILLMLATDGSWTR